jgi:hypothetical protein
MEKSGKGIAIREKMCGSKRRFFIPSIDKTETERLTKGRVTPVGLTGWSEGS